MSLRAVGLSVRTADGEPVVADVDVHVDPGELLLLCGPTGSGKTTLAKALYGLLDRRSDLVVDGEVVRPDDVGFVFQRPATQLVRRTVRRDLAFGLENRGVPPADIQRAVAASAERLGATGLLDREVATLSAGETALVALLGVLVTEPAAVVLDEPLAALDGPSTRRVLDALDALRATDTALVVAEHDATDLLARADRVLLLEDGGPAAHGPPEAVVAELYGAGVHLPFGSVVALERRAAGEAVPVPLAPSGG